MLYVLLESLVNCYKLMERFLDDKNRRLLSVLENQFPDSQIGECWEQYRAFQANADRDTSDYLLSDSLKQSISISTAGSIFITIPVAIHSSEVFSVTVELLNRCKAFLLCPSDYKLSNVRSLLSKRTSAFDAKDVLLGFAQKIDGEVIFLDETIALEKICGKSKSIEVSLIVKFYMPDILLLENPLSRHQLYLQLRRDMSTCDRFFLASQDRIHAAAYAVLSEGLDRNCCSFDSGSLADLVGWRVVEQHGVPKADAMLRAQISKLDQDLPKSVAELEFCKIVQSNENYGKRYYRIFATKDFEAQLSPLYISLSIFGLTIEEATPTISADVPPTVILHSFSWRQIARFTFAWHRLTIGIKPPQGVSPVESKNKHNNWILNYYVKKKSIGNYLLQLAADLNQFQMNLVQTYRIDRIIFPRHGLNGPLESFRASSSMLKAENGPMACENTSSTLPRKLCSYGSNYDVDSFDSSAPILAFGAHGNGRASAPPPLTMNDLIPSKMDAKQIKLPVLKVAPVPKQPLMPSLKSDSRIGLTSKIFSSKWTSLNDFRGKKEKMAANEVQVMRSTINLEKSSPVEPVQCVKPESSEVDYDFATSLVAADKVVQGITENHDSNIFQVILQRDASGSIGFSLSLDSNTRHLIVKSIKPGGAADRSGKISLGDCLVQIGDYNLTGKDYDDCVALLRSISFPVRLTFERPQQNPATTGSIISPLQDEFEHSEENEEIMEVFDELNYPNSQVPEEYSWQPSKGVDTLEFESDPELIYNQSSTYTLQHKAEGGATVADSTHQFQADYSVKASEDVMHEEMTYPSCAGLSVNSSRSTHVEYQDDDNPYAKTGEDIDEDLIDKMLNALGEDVEEKQFCDEPTFQVELSKLDDERRFGFSVSFDSGRCIVAQVDQEQAERSGLAIGDVVVAVNSQKFDRNSLSEHMAYDDQLYLTLLACVDVKHQVTNASGACYQNEAVCYDFQLPTATNTLRPTMPQQLPTVSEIVKVTVTKQPCEELGCSLFACGSEIFVGTVKPGSKLANAGIQSGDMCLLINNEPVFGMPSERVAAALRSAAGQITLTLSRKKQQSTVEETSPPEERRTSCVDDCISSVDDDMFRANIAQVLGKQLTPALRADLKRLAATWHRLTLDDHDDEFTRISQHQGFLDATVTPPTTCRALDATWIELNESYFILSNLPLSSSFVDFWQMIVDCGVCVMILMGHALFPFFPQETDEVLRVNTSLSIRLVSMHSSSENEEITLWKFSLSPLGDVDRYFYLIQCSQHPEKFSSGLVDALLLPHVLGGNSAGERASSISPILVCSDFMQTSFDQRGVFCLVSSLLGRLCTTLSSSPAQNHQQQLAIISASSIGNSAAMLRRQHQDSLRCVEQLACIYECLASSIDRLVAEDALSY